MLKHKIIGRNISILYRNESNYVDTRIKELNITKIQVEILLFVKDNPNTNLTEINNYFKFNKATITKIIKHLANENYVNIRVNCEDRREKFISVTDKALETLPKIKKIFNFWESVVVKDISEEHIEITRNVLAKMVTNMSDLKEVNE